MHATLRPYDHFGVTFHPVHEGEDEARGECPFCPGGTTQKFYVNLKTGQYNCKHCHASGNTYTFMAHIHQQYLEGTTNDDWKDLADKRYGIPWTLLRDSGYALAERAEANRWVIPVYNIKNALVNLRYYTDGRYVGGTPGMPLNIWRLEHFSGTGPIYLTEGEWDALALERLRKKAKKPGTVLALPGASQFKKEWVSLFQGRDVVICFDHDGPGEEGAERTCGMIQTVVKTVKILRWPSDAPEGWDVRDMVHQELDKSRTSPAQVWRSFELLQQTPVHLMGQTGHGDSSLPALEELDLPKRTSFNTVIKDYKSHYHMDRHMTDGLAVMMATMLSIQLPGDPLWMFIVAPPGSGKTMLLSSLQLSPAAVFKSSLTPKSLISGFRSDEGDPSLIPRLTGKVLILKDYTEITSMGREVQEEIYGILRGAYDGHCEKTFGNGLTRSYHNCHFAMLAGVTDVIYGDDRASLGERFLKYQLVSSQEIDATKHIIAAITGMAQQVEAEDFLRRVAASFLNRDITQGKIPNPEPWLVNRVVALSQVISHLRATVPRIGRNDELAYRPSPEVGTRIAKQLIKLGQCLAIIYGKTRIDKDCWQLMRRVALDTARGWNLDIFLVLANHYPKRVERDVIAAEARISHTTCLRRLDNLRLLGAVEHIPIPKEGPGQPAYGWTLAKDLANLWTTVDK